MTRLTPTSIAAAALLGLFVMGNVAEAAKSRSIQERRQRPGKGYFAPKTTQSGSYSSNRSMFQNSPQRYTAPVAPRTYAAPQQTTVPRSYVMPQQSYVPQSNVVISQPSMSAPIYRSVSPAPSAPVQSVPHISQPAPVYHR